MVAPSLDDHGSRSAGVGFARSAGPCTVISRIAMSKLEDLQPGLRLAGVIPGQSVSVVAVQPHGADAIELTYKTGAGELGQRVLGRDAERQLAVARAQARPLDAVAADFKLVAECQRIKLAGLSDPMLAVTTSDIQPLPHQLRAVYGELLPRTPLRFVEEGALELRGERRGSHYVSGPQIDAG